MHSNKRYWQDVAELDPAGHALPNSGNEFNVPQPIDEMLADKGLTGATTGRRDFLKFLGFSLTAATVAAACEAPAIKSIPYVVKPEEITPGVANWYASTYYDGDDYASVLVKTREGRPIQIKGNSRFGINRNPGKSLGSVNARINSSVITLYDSERLRGPQGKGNATTWADADKAVAAGLSAAASAGKRIVLLTGTVISPSTSAAIDLFKANVGGAAPAAAAPAAAGAETAAAPAPVTGGQVDHVQMDTISYAGLTSANEKSFGKRVFPSYDLTKADVLVSVGADFLSNWGSTTEYTWQYATRRHPDDKNPMSRHWQFETRMSLSGANADERVAVKPSQQAAVVMALHDAVAKKMGGASVGAGSLGAADARIAKCADELVAAKGRSLVICGVNDEGTQTIVNSLNAMLGNYGSTIDLSNHTFFYQGNDAAVQQLIKDMNAGNVGAILIAGVNPAYSLPNSEEFLKGLAKCGLSVSFSGYADETASKCNWICPDNHWLESWNDLRPKVGHYAIVQPTIRPLFETRQFPESLLKWSGSDKTYYEFIQGVWQTALTGHSPMPVNFAEAWNNSVHNGVYEAYTNNAEPVTFAGDLSAAAASAKKSSEAGDWEVQLYTKEGIGNGLHANNPWLQELPDPLTKATWDNYVCMSAQDLLEVLGMKDDDPDAYKKLYIGQESPAHVVKVTVNGKELKLPVIPTPGQASRTISIALGYGRGADGSTVGRAACLVDENGARMPVGQNAYPLTSVVNGTVSYSGKAAVENANDTYALALSQTQLTHMDRTSIVKETTFAKWRQHDPQGKKDEHNMYNEVEMLAVHEDVNGDHQVNALDKVPAKDVDLWGAHPVSQVGHRWGMSIDLNSCIGCGACVTACNSENNIPVVGKDEVRRSREMHWMRIDRYFSSPAKWEEGREAGKGKIGLYLEMEEPEAQPKVFFQPVMCQHCNHAPCETVCPVAATTHSLEGLNMMTYNRCIGTRYCANNCPYKVRRFNWFNYVTEQFGQVNPAWDELGRMVLNPDVTVRSRGVIEKCSMCVQIIQAGKLAAKKAGTPVKDGAIQTACAAGCPTNAITFGDLNDANSMITTLASNERTYYMLEEIGVQPNISYLAKVRNTEEEEVHHEAEKA